MGKMSVGTTGNMATLKVEWLLCHSIFYARHASSGHLHEDQIMFPRNLIFTLMKLRITVT